MSDAPTLLLSTDNAASAESAPVLLEQATAGGTMQEPAAPAAGLALVPGPTNDQAATSLSIVLPPPSTLKACNGEADPSKLEWLTEELRQEIQQWAPTVGNGRDADINTSDGVLETAFSSVFPPGRKFYCIHQAFAMAQELSTTNSNTQ